jgi:CDP-ribitol ribitolphosphotransferase
VQEDKIVFIEPHFAQMSNSYQEIYEKLVREYSYDIRCHFLQNTNPYTMAYKKRCIRMIQDIATAKYIFLDDACHVTSCLPMREETIVTQLWHGCGAFKKFGFSVAELIFGETREQMLKYPAYKNQTYITVSSPEVTWAYQEAMNTEQFGGTVCPVGVSRTDIFFNRAFREKASEKFYRLFPAAIGKKVILYAPTFRGRVADAKAPDCLDIELLQEKLASDYVLVCKHHPFVKNLPKIPQSCESFAIDLTEQMEIEELLCVSAVCISDYSSLIFEYSLFEKPMIFYAYDLEEYFDWRGFYYDYNELTPGPVFKTNNEIVEYILNLKEKFNKNEVIDFRKKFMSACDGHATERILEMVLETK